MRRRLARPALCALAAAIALAGAVARAQTGTDSDPTGTPDATITFRGRTAAAGAGFTWGAATLEYQGKTYPVRVDGFVVGGLGTAEMEGTGQVYGLSKPEDLNGDFTALTGGGVFGSGVGRSVMRNNKGVRIVMELTKASGAQVGFGPRGITMSVGEAGGPPADASARLPETLGFGEIKVGPLFLRPTLNAQLYMAAGHNSGFDGDWSFGPVDEVDRYLEHSNEEGLNLRVPLGEGNEYGLLQGRVSGVYSLTTSNPDGPICNGENDTVSEYTLESAHLAWESGELFPRLGSNAVEVSGGNQNYQVFDGLLFWDGGQDCHDRAGNWVSARKAFRETAIATVNVKNVLIEGAHLKYNDHPNTHTRLGLGRIEYATDDLFLEHLKVGFMYFNIYESDNPSRDDMQGIYVYNELNPLRSLPDLTLKGSFVREENSRSSGLTEAYGWYAAGAYQFKDAPWKPQLGYRYASFSGGGTNAFDSLFTGLPDWGSWFQGELLGEYVLSNSNLNSHQVRLKTQPLEWVTANLIYYRFLLDDKDEGFGLNGARVDKNLADELDLIVDITMTNWWSITVTGSVAFPDDGFREAVDGAATWLNGYLYTNFNF